MNLLLFKRIALKRFQAKQNMEDKYATEVMKANSVPMFRFRLRKPEEP
jgi:hypothetical protein